MSLSQKDGAELGMVTLHVETSDSELDLGSTEMQKSVATQRNEIQTTVLPHCTPIAERMAKRTKLRTSGSSAQGCGTLVHCRLG